MLAAAPVAHGEQSVTTCEGFLGDAVVEGDLVVPAGATCTGGFGHRVLGNATIEEGAQFFSEGVIEGDVDIASGGAFRNLDGAVGGDIVCMGCRVLSLTFMFDPAGVVRSTGDVVVTGMTNGFLGIEGWRVADLEVTQSQGTFTFIEFSASRDILVTGNVGNVGSWYVSADGSFEIVGNTAAGEEFPAQFTLVGNSAGKDLVFSRNTGMSYLEATRPARTSSASKTTRRPRAGGTLPAGTSRVSAPT